MKTICRKEGFKGGYVTTARSFFRVMNPLVLLHVYIQHMLQNAETREENSKISLRCSYNKNFLNCTTKKYRVITHRKHNLKDSKCYFCL